MPERQEAQCSRPNNLWRSIESIQAFIKRRQYQFSRLLPSDGEYLKARATQKIFRRAGGNR
jgi:hypothetical protein